MFVNKVIAYLVLGCTLHSSRVAVGFTSVPSRRTWSRTIGEGGDCREILHPESVLAGDRTSRSSLTSVKHTSSSGSRRGRNSRTVLTAAPAVSIPDAAKSIATALFPAGSVPLRYAFSLNFILFSLLRTKLNKMLTTAGYYHAMALGTGLWATMGWRGWTLNVVYLFLGQAVTKVKFEEKTKLGIAEGRGGRRGPENVWGSALTCLICAIISSRGKTVFGVSPALFNLACVASIATKLSDTFASEIGKAYGKTTFLITTFERVEAGTEGAVSAEGTAAAMVGGLLISLYGYATGLISSWNGVGISTIAAFLATNAESLIGATMQGKSGLDWMTNEVVNFINTVIGAGLAIGGGKLLL